VAVTGASGFIGRALVPALGLAGCSVRTIGRGGTNDFRWDPEVGTIDSEALAGVDSVVHLAGTNIAVRWTARTRREIVDSRTLGTRLIASAFAASDGGATAPRVLVSASAIGFYGDRGNAPLDDASSIGDGFLADVVRQWESAAEPARAAGIRTVHARIGVVLSASGGALRRLLLPFRLGLGGRIGAGTQWMSWVSLDDTVRAIQFAIDDDTLYGAVNVVAPEPVTSAEFTTTLARVLSRPALVPVPAAALRLMFGAMADETLLASQRARPARLLSAGFRFSHPALDEALRFELGRAK
jgi:uncharacterized protein (TIGR01777 family)